MSKIIELSTGHIFAEGSVRAISPVATSYNYGVRFAQFTVYGEGYEVPIHMSQEVGRENCDHPMRLKAEKEATQTFEAIHKEAVDKLLGSYDS